MPGRIRRIGQPSQGLSVGDVHFSSANPNSDLFKAADGAYLSSDTYPGFKARGDWIVYPLSKGTVPTPPPDKRVMKVIDAGNGELFAVERFSLSGNGSPLNQIWKSADGGDTWSLIGQGSSSPWDSWGSIMDLHIVYDDVSSRYVWFIWGANNGGTYHIFIFSSADNVTFTQDHILSYLSSDSYGSGNDRCMNSFRGSDGSFILNDGLRRIHKKPSGQALNNGTGWTSSDFSPPSGYNYSSHFLNKSASGELFRWHYGESSYKTSVDNGSTWTDRTSPINIGFVQSGPEGWLIGPRSDAASTLMRVTDDHSSYSSVNTGLSSVSAWVYGLRIPEPIDFYLLVLGSSERDLYYSYNLVDFYLADVDDYSFYIAGTLADGELWVYTSPANPSNKPIVRLSVAEESIRLPTIPAFQDKNAYVKVL